MLHVPTMTRPQHLLRGSQRQHRHRDDADPSRKAASGQAKAYHGLVLLHDALVQVRQLTEACILRYGLQATLPNLTTTHCRSEGSPRDVPSRCCISNSSGLSPSSLVTWDGLPIGTIQDHICRALAHILSLHDRQRLSPPPAWRNGRSSRFYPLTWCRDRSHGIRSEGSGGPWHGWRTRSCRTSSFGRPG